MKSHRKPRKHLTELTPRVIATPQLVAVVAGRSALVARDGVLVHHPVQLRAM
jgi:hypothetical protein